jgi:hypothetical protein
MQSACSAYVFRLFRQETARGIIEYLREGSSAWSEDNFGIIIMCWLGKGKSQNRFPLMIYENKPPRINWHFNFVTGITSVMGEWRDQQSILPGSLRLRESPDAAPFASNSSQLGSHKSMHPGSLLGGHQGIFLPLWRFLV